MGNALDGMTRKQLYRLYCQAWERMTRYDGYQPFGYDRRTLAITSPSWLRLIDAIAAANDRKVSQC